MGLHGGDFGSGQVLDYIEDPSGRAYKQQWVAPELLRQEANSKGGSTLGIRSEARYVSYKRVLTTE